MNVALFLGQVIGTNVDDLVFEAFKKMRENQIGGLPVVQGPKKKIVGNVSISDIRFSLLKPELFNNFRYRNQTLDLICMH